VSAMKFRLSGEFGELSPVRDFKPHSGIDIAMPEGTTLRAVGEGIVDRIYDGTDAIGKGLSIKFDDGTRAIYGHMSDVKAKVGQHVDAGQIVGYSGNTGHSTAPHLHFGMKDADGSLLDPTPMFDFVKEIDGKTYLDFSGLGRNFMERGNVGTYEHADVTALDKLVDIIGGEFHDLIVSAIHGLTAIMPEIGAFLTIICAVAMMFSGDIAKWSVRWGIVMTGVIAWLIGVK
jgi:hypothetical protein